MIERSSPFSSASADRPNRWADLLRPAQSSRIAIPHAELWVAAAVGLSIFGALVFPTRAMMAALVILAAVAVPWGICATRQHVNGLLILLALIETATASWWVATAGGNIGAIIRYPLILLFCLPVSLSVWRSGILQQGGFRDYSIYLLWALLSAIYSLLPALTAQRVVATFLPFIAICAVAERIKSGEDARRAMGVFFAACGFVVAINTIALVAAPGEISWHPDPETGMLRFSGIFTEPNQIGSLTLATLGAGFAWWPLARGWQRTLTALVIGAAILIAVLADSRSPLLGVAFGGALYVMWRWRLRGIFGVVALMILFYAAVAVIPGTHDYLNRGDVGSFTGRQTAWDFAIRSIKERPLFGYGYEVEGQILQSQYFSGWDDLWSEGAKSSLHNGFLSRAVSMGIPALVFWLFITMRPMLSVFRRDQDPWDLKSLALLCILPVLVLNFTESVGDFRSFPGIEICFAWALLERERLFTRTDRVEREQQAQESQSPLFRALRTG
jgi:O-antigen ligase